LFSLLNSVTQRLGLSLGSATDSEGSVLVAVASARESVRFGATDDESLALLGNKIVRRQLDKNAITYETYKLWRTKNPLIFVPVVTDKDELVGFFDIFPLHREFGERLINGSLDEHSLTVDGIVPFGEIGSAEYLHIATIMINPRQKAFCSLVARETLLLKLKEFLETHYKPVSSRTYTAYAQTMAGEALLKRSGFSLAVFRENSSQRCPLYVLRPSNNETALLRFDRAGLCVSTTHKRVQAIAEIDSNIEGVELKLRSLIATQLADDPLRLPPHVSQKLNDRITAAKRKDPAFEDMRLAKLSLRLEFADFRELADTILNKSLWALFKSRFVNQETTVQKFGQLGDLRNAIRHSRRINEIVQKEGEAAIMWFEQVLDSPVRNADIE
jgi:hypothetical protein